MDVHNPGHLLLFEDSKILKIQFPEPESSVTQKCSLLNSHTCVNGKPILEDNIKVTITFEVHTKILEYNIMPFILKAKIENLIFFDQIHT